MKKILFFSIKDYNFYNFRSEMILKLVEMNYDVLLVCPYGSKIDYFTSKGCRFIDIKVDRRGKNVFKDLAFMRDFSKIVKSEKPDIVLAFTTKASIYGGIVCKKLKIPYIINNAGLTHTNGILKMIMNFLYKAGFKKASCLMFQNHEERDYILKLLPKNVRYLDIPGSGVNLNDFSYMDYPDSDDTVIFNYVGRIVETKGINEYLSCAKLIHSKHPNTVFRIFGDYDDDSYKSIINDLEKEGVVEYKGVILDMKPWIRECHAAIHPSYYEGMTNVVLEHSASGRPCIGSNIPGVADGIEDNKTGYLFEKGNVDSLVTAVEHFLKLPNSEKRQMGVRARTKMEKEFDREIVTNTYINEVKNIIG